MALVYALMVAIQMWIIHSQAAPAVVAPERMNGAELEVEKDAGSPGHPLLEKSAVSIHLLAEGFDSVGGIRKDAEKGRLFVSDTGGRAIYMLDASNSLTEFISGSAGAVDSRGKELIHVLSPGGLEVDSSGRVIVCDQGARSVRRRESRYRWKDIAISFQGESLGGPVDICMAGDGSIYFTDSPGMDSDSRAVPGLYRRARNGRISRLHDGLTKPMHLALSESGDALYVTNHDESAPGVFKFPVLDSGRLGDPVGWPEASGVESQWHGAPLAIATLRDSTIAVAHDNSVSLFTEDGRRLGTLRFPEKITSLEFSPDENALFAGGRTSLYRVMPSGS